MAVPLWTLLLTDSARTSWQELPTPLAYIIDRLKSTKSSSEAIDCINDFYKLSLNILLLISLQIVATNDIRLPHEVALAVKSKWLKGKKRDLTEAERWKCFLANLDCLDDALPNDVFLGEIRRCFPARDAFEDERSLRDFKNDDSHRTHPEDAYAETSLRDVAPAFQAWLDRLQLFLSLSICHHDGHTTYRIHGVGKPEIVDAISASPGMYLVDRCKAHFTLSPFFLFAKSQVDDAREVMYVFSYGRSASSAILLETGANAGAATECDQCMAELGSLVRNAQPQPVIGNICARDKVRATIADLASGASPRPLCVVGEEGMGKTLIVDEALQSYARQLHVVRVSGANRVSEPDARATAVELLGSLFGESAIYDGKIVERLRAFCEANVLLAPRKLVKWLQEPSTERHTPPSMYGGREWSEQPSNLSDFSRPEKQGRAGDESPYSPFPDLWRVLVAFAEVSRRGVVLWLQDAQLFDFEDSPIQFLEFACPAEVPLLVIGEFRTERKSNLRRVKARFSSAADFVACEALNSGQILSLIAATVEVAENAISSTLSRTVFQTTGGNPKFAIEVVKYLVQEDMLKRVSFDSLVYRPDAKITLPSGIRATYRARIENASLSRTSKQVLGLLAFARHEFIRADMVEDLLGGDARGCLAYLTDEVQILREPPVDAEHSTHWRVGFEHLTGREVARDLLREDTTGLAGSLLECIRQFVLVEASDDKVKAFWKRIVPELATIAGDGNALARYIVPRIVFAQKKDLSVLQSWSKVLIRDRLEPFGDAVKRYMALRMKEIESPQADLFQPYRALAKDAAPLVESELTDEERYYLLQMLASAYCRSLHHNASEYEVIVGDLMRVAASTAERVPDEGVRSSLLGPYFQRVGDYIKRFRGDVAELYACLRQASVVSMLPPQSQISLVLWAREYLFFAGLPPSLDQWLASDIELASAVYENGVEEASEGGPGVGWDGQFAQLTRRVATALVVSQFRAAARDFGSDPETITSAYEQFCRRMSRIEPTRETQDHEEWRQGLESAHRQFAVSLSAAGDAQSAAQAIESLSPLSLRSSIKNLRALSMTDAFSGQTMLVPSLKTFLDDLESDTRCLLALTATDLEALAAAASSVLHEEDLLARVTRLLARWLATSPVAQDDIIQATESLASIQVRMPEFLGDAWDAVLLGDFRLDEEKAVASTIADVARYRFESRSQRDESKEHLYAVLDRLIATQKEWNEDRPSTVSVAYAVAVALADLASLLSVSVPRDKGYLRHICRGLQDAERSRSLARYEGYWAHRWSLEAHLGDAHVALLQCQDMLRRGETLMRVFLLKWAAKLSAPSVFWEGYAEDEGDLGAAECFIDLAWQITPWDVGLLRLYAQLAVDKHEGFSTRPVLDKVRERMQLPYVRAARRGYGPLLGSMGTAYFRHGAYSEALEMNAARVRLLGEMGEANSLEWLEARNIEAFVLLATDVADDERRHVADVIDTWREMLHELEEPRTEVQDAAHRDRLEALVQYDLALARLYCDISHAAARDDLAQLADGRSNRGTKQRASLVVLVPDPAPAQVFAIVGDTSLGLALAVSRYTLGLRDGVSDLARLGESVALEWAERPSSHEGLSRWVGEIAETHGFKLTKGQPAIARETPRKKQV